VTSPTQPIRIQPPPRAAESVLVALPGHPMHALTTFELRDYRRQLENAIALLDKQTPVPPARDGLQARLDDVIAEQDDRNRLADG
jgi:hypothetical protein